VNATEPKVWVLPTGDKVEQRSGGTWTIFARGGRGFLYCGDAAGCLALIERHGWDKP
jgi:hypothetical protein